MQTQSPLTFPGVSVTFWPHARLYLTCFIVNTETYHAQYHVLEAFSFFNMILSESPPTLLRRALYTYRPCDPVPSLRIPCIIIGACHPGTPCGYEARLGSPGDHDLLVRSDRPTCGQASCPSHPPIPIAVSASARGGEREGETQGAVAVAPRC